MIYNIALTNTVSDYNLNNPYSFDTMCSNSGHKLDVQTSFLNLTYSKFPTHSHKYITHAL